MLPIQALTVVFGGTRFYVHPEVLVPAQSNPVINLVLNVCQGTVQNFELLNRTVRPAVVFSVADESLSDKTISERLNSFAEVDDVYTTDFHDILLLQSVREPAGQAVIERLNRDGLFNSVFTFTVQSETDLLPAGPYFICEDGIHQAWRLYSDYLDAFIHAVVPDSVEWPNKYSVLQAVAKDGLHKSVAVPSRLYASPSKEKPLAGARISLKDNIKLAGVKTTMMNRAYTELYEPEPISAVYAARLADLGAIIVGKTKMCAFASAQEPTDQWIDYHCPFNPRGDMYQSPSGSTTGGGASLAGYQWLDYSVGTDTSGSIRSPAAYNGLFSLRSSFQSGPMNGIVESCRLFDTIGILCRTVRGCHRMAETTLDLTDSHHFPRKILYPLDFFPQPDNEQQRMTDSFVRVLENFLGVKKTEISLAKYWEEHPPQEAHGKSLREYLDKSAAWPMQYYAYHAFDEFRDQYKLKLKKEVYVGPYMQVRWTIGAKVTPEDRDQGIAELSVFRRWFNANIMSASSGLLSDAVLIMPFGKAEPKYRDTPNSVASTLVTLSPFYLAPTLQLPQFIIPVGQKRYSSRVSGRDEYLPIVSSLMGAKGSDLMLMNLVEAALKAASWPTAVKTGRYMFELGNNGRNVAMTGDVDGRPQNSAEQAL